MRLKMKLLELISYGLSQTLYIYMPSTLINCPSQRARRGTHSRTHTQIALRKEPGGSTHTHTHTVTHTHTHSRTRVHARTLPRTRATGGAPLARNHTFLQKHRKPHAWIREQLSKSAHLPDPTHAWTKYPRSGEPLTPILNL